MEDRLALATAPTDRVDAPAQRKWALATIVRPVVSAILLAILLSGAPLWEFVSLVQRANLAFLGVSFVLVVAALVVSAYKWQRLLAVQQVGVPLGRLFSSYLVGLFFNNFLPTNIGGDVVRMNDVARYSGKSAEAVASVIGERLLAAFALALTAVLGLLLSYQVAGRFGGIVAAVFLLTLTIVGVFAKRSWRESLGKRVVLPERFSLRQRLGPVASSMSTCLSDRATLIWVLIWSLVFHLIVVLINYVIFLALGLDVPLVYCLLFIPLISAIQMLPVSVNGLGVREGAYVYFFGSVGLTGAEAIASSLTFWALVALVSLAGGAVFALRR